MVLIQGIQRNVWWKWCAFYSSSPVTPPPLAPTGTIIIIGTIIIYGELNRNILEISMEAQLEVYQIHMLAGCQNCYLQWRANFWE